MKLRRVTVLALLTVVSLGLPASAALASPAPTPYIMASEKCC